MKKPFSLMLILGLLASLGLPALGAEAVIPIATRQELEAIGRAPEANYRLEADIDLGEADWTPIPFSGTLDGNGHTLYNLRIRRTGEHTGDTIDGNFKHYSTRFAALFSTVAGAEIRDLTILGADVKLSADEHCFAAILAGSATDTAIENCHISGRVQLYTTNIMAGVAGMVGFGHGEIRDSSADVELIFADRSDRSTGLRCEQFLGGLVGTGVFTMQGNTVNLHGVDSCFGYVHNGGLNGMHYCYTGVPNREVSGNQVTGTITFFENNPNRRAYCDAFIGEKLPQPTIMRDNISDFVRDERPRNQTRELAPHECAAPSLKLRVIEPTETEFGFTLLQCATCGYSLKNRYTAPVLPEPEPTRPQSLDSLSAVGAYAAEMLLDCNP